MTVKNIRLCEGHKGGFGLVGIVFPMAAYRGTPVTKLKVVLVDKEECVLCIINKRVRRREK